MSDLVYEATPGVYANDEEAPEPTGAEQQNKLVGDFILANCPGEIIDGGAGDIAVLLLERFATNVQAALKELGMVKFEDYSPAVANAVDFLNKALGKWGQL